MIKNEFVNYVIDLLSPYGHIKARAMFGGYGLYKDGIIVAIIADDELYFKVDKESIEVYKSRDSRPFCYKVRDKIINMSYWYVPLEVMENEKLLGNCLDMAYLATINAKNNKNKKKP